MCGDKKLGSYFALPLVLEAFMLPKLMILKREKIEKILNVLQLEVALEVVPIMYLSSQYYFHPLLILDPFSRNRV